MALTYVGNGAAIVGIPASDLSNEELSDIAARENLSLAELEGLLIKRGLYKSASKASAKSAPKEKDEQ